MYGWRAGEHKKIGQKPKISENRDVTTARPEELGEGIGTKNPEPEM